VKVEKVPCPVDFLRVGKNPRCSTGLAALRPKMLDFYVLPGTGPITGQPQALLLDPIRDCGKEDGVAEMALVPDSAGLSAL